MKVVAFRRGDQRGVQPIAIDHGTHGVEAWSTVGSNGREEREPDTELIQAGAARFLEVGPHLAELSPGDHPVAPSKQPPSA
jgi:hypothetical protein